jgi:hypothetical protein
MPEWINAKDRMPVKAAQYFVKINGMKDLMRIHEIERKVEHDYDVLWLDESDLAQQLAKDMASVKSIEEMVKLRYHSPNADLIEKPSVVKPIKEAQKSVTPNIIQAITDGKSINKEYYIRYLENLFGVKKADKLIKKSKKLKHK